MTDPIAVFRTVGGAHIPIGTTENGFTAECGGCDWSMSSQWATRGARGVMGRPTDPVGALKYEANLHALGCTEVPHEQWPGYLDGR